MKKKKLNKAHRQAGHRLCNNIKNTRNQNLPAAGFKKSEQNVLGNFTQEYITNATGEYSMDQHVDISKLVELKRKLAMETIKEGPQEITKPQENSSWGRTITGAFGRLIKILRKKTA